MTDHIRLDRSIPELSDNDLSNLKYGDMVYTFNLGERVNGLIQHVYYLGSLKALGVAKTIDTYFIVVLKSGGFPHRVHISELKSNFFLTKIDAIKESIRRQENRKPLRKVYAEELANEQLKEEEK